MQFDGIGSPKVAARKIDADPCYLSNWDGIYIPAARFGGPGDRIKTHYDDDSLACSSLQQAEVISLCVIFASMRRSTINVVIEAPRTSLYCSFRRQAPDVARVVAYFYSCLAMVALQYPTSGLSRSCAVMWVSSDPRSVSGCELSMPAVCRHRHAESVTHERHGNTRSVTLHGSVKLTSRDTTALSDAMHCSAQTVACRNASNSASGCLRASLYSLELQV